MIKLILSCPVAPGYLDCRVIESIEQYPTRYSGYTVEMVTAKHWYCWYPADCGWSPINGVACAKILHDKEPSTHFEFCRRAAAGQRRTTRHPEPVLPVAVNHVATTEQPVLLLQQTQGAFKTE
jgi:hypothetical protein